MKFMKITKYIIASTLLGLMACSTPTGTDDAGSSSVANGSNESNGNSEAVVDNNSSEGDSGNSSAGEVSSDKEVSSSSKGKVKTAVNPQNCEYSASANTLKCEENTYKTVVIGEQTWMAENLNYGTMVKVFSSEDEYQELFQKFCWDNDEANCEKKGALYQWPTTIGCDAIDIPENTACEPGKSAGGQPQGICPLGWHVPMRDEIVEFFKYVTGGDASVGYASLKSKEFGGTDDFGFNLISTGFSRKGTFNMSAVTYIRIADGPGGYQFSPNDGETHYLNNGASTNGYPVRCLKD